MLEQLKARWDNLRSSLWFTPTVIVGVAMVLAWTVLRLDRWVAGTDLAGLAWAFSGGPESARQLLGTIAGSMITLTGVTFSITLAALVLAAGQYSPRILRNFMRDRFNQTVLGVFIGTFAYCILLLRSIRGGDSVFVPAVGITTAIGLAMLSLGFFIFFIHHIARSIQVSSMIAAVGEETHDAIDALFRRDRGAVGPAWIGSAPAPLPPGHRVNATRDGYVQRLDVERLCERAAEAGVALELLVGPGDFTARGLPVAVADPVPDDPAGFDEGVRACIFLGRQRTMAQDPAFGFRQLVDIAVRALSPGINDPTTASNAVDILGSLLADLADRPWPANTFVDDDGALRLRLPAAIFDDYVTLAFTEIRRYANNDLAVTLRLLDALALVALATERADRRAAAWEAAHNVIAGVRRENLVVTDRQRIDARFRRIATVLGEDADAHLPAGSAP